MHNSWDGALVFHLVQACRRMSSETRDREMEKGWSVDECPHCKEGVNASVVTEHGV